MITFFIIKAIISVISIVFIFMPVIEELPFGVDAYIEQGVSGYKLLASYFPPLDLFMDLFLIYIGYKLIMLLIKFILGNRTPSYSN